MILTTGFSPPFPNAITVRNYQGAIICVLTYRRYANMPVWNFFVFNQVPRRYVELLLSSMYLHFAGTIGPYQALEGICT